MTSKKLSILVVGGALGVLLLYLGWMFAPSHKEFTLLILMPLLYEAWMLLNKGTGDTISEAHWWLAQRPLVPFIYGILTFWVMFLSGWHIILICAWVGLMAHFWFQSQDVYWKVWEEKKNGG